MELLGAKGCSRSFLSSIISFTRSAMRSTSASSFVADVAIKKNYIRQCQQTEVFLLGALNDYEDEFQSLVAV